MQPVPQFPLQGKGNVAEVTLETAHCLGCLVHIPKHGPLSKRALGADSHPVF